MWHISRLQLVRHVVMCLLIAALKDKPLIFASDVVNDLSTSVFLFRDNGRVRRERKAHFRFFSSTLFYVTSWFMESRSSLIEMSVCAARIMDCVFSPNSKSSTSSWNLLQDDPIFSSSSFPHVELISLRWCHLWAFCGGSNHMIKPNHKVWLLHLRLFDISQICISNQGESDQFRLQIRRD